MLPMLIRILCTYSPYYCKLIIIIDYMINWYLILDVTGKHLPSYCQLAKLKIIIGNTTFILGQWGRIFQYNCHSATQEACNESRQRIPYSLPISYRRKKTARKFRCQVI